MWKFALFVIGLVILGIICSSSMNNGSGSRSVNQNETVSNDGAGSSQDDASCLFSHPFVVDESVFLIIEKSVLAAAKAGARVQTTVPMGSVLIASKGECEGTNFFGYGKVYPFQNGKLKEPILGWVHLSDGNVNHYVHPDAAEEWGIDDDVLLKLPDGSQPVPTLVPVIDVAQGEADFDQVLVVLPTLTPFPTATPRPTQTPIPVVPTLQPVITPVPTATPGEMMISDGTTCPADVVQKAAVDAQTVSGVAWTFPLVARVETSKSDKNRLRAQPGTSGELISMIEPGRQFAIVGNSVCRNEMWFMPVAVVTQSNEYIPGWMAQGNSERAFIDSIEPLRPESQDYGNLVAVAASFNASTWGK